MAIQSDDILSITEQLQDIFPNAQIEYGKDLSWVSTTVKEVTERQFNLLKELTDAVLYSFSMNIDRNTSEIKLTFSDQLKN